MCPKQDDKEIQDKAKKRQDEAREFTAKADKAGAGLISTRAGAEGISANLRIDLRPYIESFESEDKEAHELYDNYLRTRITGITGAELWQRVKETAFEAEIQRLSQLLFCTLKGPFQLPRNGTTRVAH